MHASRRCGRRSPGATISFPNKSRASFFRSLAVFAGGCTLEAAEDVADADLNTLQSLVEKSLVRFSDERYSMLETIREYAGERLAEKGETRELGLRHAEFFLALADEAWPHLETHEQAEWLGRIEVEHDNVRAALSCLESADADRLLRLAVDVWRFWLMRAHFAEGRQWLRRSLSYQERGDTLHALGNVRLLENDYERALEWLKQAEALNRAQGHEWDVAQDLIARAYALHGLGRDDEATSLLRQSLELLRPLKEVRLLTNCFDGLSATFAADQSDIAASLAAAAEILREERGVTAGSLSQKWNPVTWETLRNRLSERSLARSIERGRAMDLETAVAFALASTD
jgi:tetratricopeptide (TPR) repeat protein